MGAQIIGGSVLSTGLAGHPKVSKADREDYREGYRRGYDAAMDHLTGHPGPR
jgi:hypothetical protein